MFDFSSSFDPQGDQPRAIESLVCGLESGVSRQTLLGVTGSGKTFVLAMAIARVGRPVLVMAPNKTLAAQLYSEFKEFFPKSAVEYFVSYYDYFQPEAYVPSKDLYIEKDSAINEQIQQMRLSATKALLERRDVIVVATVSAIYGLGSPSDYATMAVGLAPGQRMSRADLIAKLVAIGYKRSQADFCRGMFRVRGEVVDVYPSEHSCGAIRVEFSDDSIGALSSLDELTGRRLAGVDRFSVYPAGHYAVPDETMKRAVSSIRAELADRLAELREKGLLVEEQRLATRTGFDLEMMEETGFCKGVENYSRHLTGQKAGDPPSTLFDYLPKDSILIMDESHVTVPQVGGMFKGDRARKENLVNFGFRLPSALDNRPLRFDEFERKSPQTIFVSATPGDYEVLKSGPPVELLIRPTGIVDPPIEVRPATTQVDDFLMDAKRTVKSGWRVLGTCLTKKMAERLGGFLNDNGMRAKYLHSDVPNVERIEIIRDLRLGKFDVLIGINLLREGLDLPEVALVAVFDADKEGFLRSERSLVQTMGRAARNPFGRVVFYADRETDSMKAAIRVCSHRREIQEKWNKANGIVPALAQSSVKDLMDGAEGTKTEGVKFGGKAEKQVLFGVRGIDEAEKRIAKLQREMLLAAKGLEFERAASLRDEISELRNAVAFGIVD